MAPVSQTIDQLFSGRFLKAADISNDQLLIISDVNIEPIGPDKEMKLVLSFQGMDKTLVVNKTNAGLLSSLFGKDPNAWVNHQVVVYIDHGVYFQGKPTPALRIRAPRNRPAVSSAAFIPPPPPDPDYDDQELMEP